jgi:hypothetical protein
MDPVSMIVTALIAGAAATSQDVGGQALKDAYNGLKSLIKKKLAGNTLGQAAVDEVTGAAKPDPAATAVVTAKLEQAKAGDDAELIAQAKGLAELLKQVDQQRGTTYSASLTGDGAIAQGPGARAVGKGGVYVGGNAGNINTGTQISTGGGAYVRGNVTAGGDFVGRDKIVGAAQTGDDAAASAAISGASEAEKAQMRRLTDALSGFMFSEDDLRELCAALDVDWDNLGGETKKAKARALVHDRFRAGALDALYALVKEARPKLGL